MRFFECDEQIDKIGFSNKTLHVLTDSNIKTIKDLVACKIDYWSIKGSGKKTVKEIYEFLMGIKDRTIVVVGLSDGDIDGISIESDSRIGTLDIHENIHVTNDSSITMLGLSSRAIRAMRKIGVMTVGDLLDTDFENNAIIGAGQVTLEEIKNKREELLSDVIVENHKSENPFFESLVEYKELVDSLSEGLKIKKSLLYEEIDNIEKTQRDRTQSYKERLLCNSNVCRKHIQARLINLIKEEGCLKKDTVTEWFPEIYRNTTIVEECANDLEQERKISIGLNSYRLRQLSVVDVIDTLQNLREREFIEWRLQGHSLEDIAQKYSITRERVRQIIIKATRKLPAVKEDKYIDIFDKYVFDLSTFLAVFSTETPVTFYYLKHLKSEKNDKEKKSLYEILDDEQVPLEVRRNAMKVVHKSDVNIDGIYVKNDIISLLSYALRTRCKNQMSVEKFIEVYNGMIDDYVQIDDYRMACDRAAFGKIERLENILWMPGKTIRYYNFEEYDMDYFVKEIDIKKYQNQVISAKKIYLDNISLMEDYDVRDHYELHDMLKKIWKNHGNTSDVEFDRNPSLTIGSADRNEQVYRLMVQNAPISNVELADLYEEKYGDLAQTVLGSYFKEINKKYNNNGLLMVPKTVLSEEEAKLAGEYLDNEFYTIEDFAIALGNALKDKSKAIVNPYIIDQLGFVLKSGYVYSGKYASADEFFRHILSEEVFDADGLPNGMWQNNTFSAYLQNALDSKQLLEFEPKHFIHIKKLEKSGITLENLDDYCEKVNSFLLPNTVFTIESLRKDGFSHPLEDLGFDSWFYASLVARDKKRYKAIRFGGNRILYSSTDEFTLGEFVTQAFYEYGENKIDIYDFYDFIRARYQISTSLYKVIEMIKDTDLYYDKIMETVYDSYDRYYEEI